MFIKIIKTSCLIAGVFALSVANASTSKDMDLAEVTQASTAIVTGEVISSVTVMNGNKPETRITLSVGEQLKGNTSPTITIVMPGGNFQQGKFRIGETVPGISPVLPTQESLYFLSNLSEADEYQVVGFNQGQLSLSHVDGEIMITGKLTRGAQYSLSEMKAKIDVAQGQ